MSRASEKPRLWLPQHWPMWFGLGVFRLASELPWSVQRALAKLLGAFTYHVIPIRRHVVLVNLQLCFPEKSAAEIRAFDDRAESWSRHTFGRRFNDKPDSALPKPENP